MSIKIRSIILTATAIAAFAAPALAESTNCTVTAPEIRLRKSPSKKAKVVAILKKETKVSAEKCSGGWVKVSSEDGKMAGYVGGWALAAAPVMVASVEPVAVSAPAPAAEPVKEVPSNEKLAMQITDLRLKMLTVERDVAMMRKDIKKIKVAMKHKK
ncbi:SH3 domain-containing protein [Geomonas terrae]|uniref:SH3 domain-containing protein n=1 Tax=Geomonas terrae TaxID=2562681 RepID=A0A4S1CDP0_9BACT|nr:SH3 domain-containing protein [Geomonas terrae]TGU71578.1 SH3 domain-containing protein [Geomonas terrae]